MGRKARAGVWTRWEKGRRDARKEEERGERMTGEEEMKKGQNIQAGSLSAPSLNNPTHIFLIRFH